MRALLLVLIPGVAVADVGGEVATGAGGEAGGASYGVATASGHASYERDAPALDRRGLHMCDVSGAGCLWVFTGLDREERDGVGATATAQLLLRDDRESIVGGEAWAAYAGWKLSARGDVQPVGDLRDGFWRSGRGIYQREVRVDVPGMWAIGNERQQLIVMPGHVALGERTAREAGVWHHAGFDRDIELVAMRWQSARHTLELADMRYAEWGVKTARIDDVTYGESADTLDVGASLRVQVAEPLELYVRAGVSSYAPVSAFMLHGNSEEATGPFTLTGEYWGEARLATGGARAVLGGGTWTRLDPSGHAVDHGHAASAELSWTAGRVDLHAALRGGRLERILVGLLAPPGLAPVGTRTWMGRGALDASVRVLGAFRLAATAWVERSDRDDPRWLAPTTGLATRAGADLSLSYRFATAWTR